MTQSPKKSNQTIKDALVIFRVEDVYIFKLLTKSERISTYVFDNDFES